MYKYFVDVDKRITICIYIDLYQKGLRYLQFGRLAKIRLGMFDMDDWMSLYVG